MSRQKKVFSSQKEMLAFVGATELDNVVINGFTVEFEGKSDEEITLEEENAKLKAELEGLEKVETPSVELEDIKKENTVLKMQNGKLKKEVERLNGANAELTEELAKANEVQADPQPADKK